MVRKKKSHINDLSKIRFKPGKYGVIKSILTTTPTITSTMINGTFPAGQCSSGVADNHINIDDIDDNNGKLVSNFSSIKKLFHNPIKKTQYQVPTSNKFGVLAENVVENDETMETTTNPHELPEDNNDSTIHLQSNKKPAKPPPIVIHHKTEKSRELVNLLKPEIKKGFEIKYTKNNTNLYIQDTEEYNKILPQIKLLADDEFQFHTYTQKSEKTHAFVLKGLDVGTDTEYLREEFRNQNKIQVIEIYKMKNTNSLFLIVTDNSITEKYLNKNLKVICHTRITWSRHENHKQITQCRRCQQWGHSTSNCSAKVTCLKCSLSHWSRDCTLVKKEDESTHKNIKCPNCEGKHLAFSQECPVYLRRIELLNKSKAKRAEIHNTKSQFIPAPIPIRNPWTRSYTNQQPHHTIPEQHTQLSIPQTNQHQPDTSNNLNTLMAEFNTLNSLIDLTHMLTLVRELNSKLKNCRNLQDQFMTFAEFCKEKFDQSSSP